MVMLRASTLGLLGVTLLCAASCDGSSVVLPLHRGAGAAGRLANAGGGEGGEGGALEAPLGGGGTKSSGGTNSGSGGTGASSSKAGRGGTSASGGTGANPGLMRGGSGGTRNETGGDAGTSDTAGAGGTAAPDQLSLCIRLGTSSTALDERVTLDFEDAFFGDCHVSWVFDLYYDESKNLNQRAAFLSQVGQFNYALWGCALTSPPDSFDLIYRPEPLTLADATALIDAYVRVATKDLSMSPGEISAMRAILVRLSEPLLISPDPGGFSQARCDVTSGAGGEGGGAGEAGQAGRGSGGEPASGQAGTGQAGAG